MNYKETLDFIFSQLPMYQRQGKAAYKANLDNTIELDNYFGNPHKYFKSIHIGGTNGKGSVSNILSSILQEAGYKVGLYTSPHLRDFRERIKINGKEIGEQEVIDFVANNTAIIKKINPSFFEMTVAMAFNYFNKEKVDIAIIEVGLGGRLDSTNIISPLLSCITNISKDHTNLLGDTIQQIAKEKAGIIKENTPVIIGESNELINDIFIQKAKETNSKIYFADKENKIDYIETIENKQHFSYKTSRYLLDLAGRYQEKNLTTTLEAIKHLKNLNIDISETSIQKGLENIIANTNFAGRWQQLSSNPLIICDTGHNEEGILNIINQLKNTEYNHLHFILGMVNDKNIEKVLSLLPQEATYYFTRASIPRALDQENLKSLANNYNLKGSTYKSVAIALENAKLNYNKGDLIFIGGSTFVVAEVV